MKIEKVKIERLKLNPANPRTIKDEKFAQLVRSVRDFPQMLEIRPIVVNAQMEVLGGNMRLRACIEAGLKEVPIIRAENLTDDQQREFIIKDNVGFGEWDFDALANEWDATELSEWGLDVPDFAAGVGPGEAQEDNYEVPEEIETDIVAGDLFEIGHHRLLCGDSTKAEDVARLFCGDIAEIIFTDPDYSMSEADLFMCYANVKDAYKKASMWVCSDKQAVRLASNDFDRFSSFFIHDFKIPTLISNYRAMQRHNMICIFGSAAIINRMDGFSTIVPVATERTLESHNITPMAKRVGLPAEFILHFTNENDIVADIFCHSGSTIVAAHQLSRRCYGIEIEPKYCHVVIDRMLKLDPDLEIKKNGQPYLFEQTKVV